MRNSDNRKVQANITSKILESKTLALRLEGCNEQQLRELPQHVIGVPRELEFHPFCFIDYKEQAQIQKQLVGHNPTAISEHRCQFRMDFGFFRASTEGFMTPNLNYQCQQIKPL